MVIYSCNTWYCRCIIFKINILQRFNIWKKANPFSKSQLNIIKNILITLYRKTRLIIKDRNNSGLHKPTSYQPSTESSPGKYCYSHFLIFLAACYNPSKVGSPY